MTRLCAHQSLRGDVNGEVVYEQHYRGPIVADVFSVRNRWWPLLWASPSAMAAAPTSTSRSTTSCSLVNTPSAGQSWRHLLTMTGGSETDGQYEIDEVMALPGGWVDRAASAAQGRSAPSWPSALAVSLNGSWNGVQMVDPAYALR
jgi:hypothetical protein